MGTVMGIGHINIDALIETDLRLLLFTNFLPEHFHESNNLW